MNHRLRLTAVLMLLLHGTSALAAGKGNFYGYMKATADNVADAPIEITRAGIQDNASQSMAGKIFGGDLSPGTSSGEYKQATVRYDCAFLSKARGVVAVEVVWSALNAFGEPLGVKTIAIPFKKPLTPGSTKNTNETQERIHDDVAKYSVRVSRVKMEDGSVWIAPPPSTASAAAGQ